MAAVSEMMFVFLCFSTACLCSNEAQSASACLRNTRVCANASALAHVQRKCRHKQKSRAGLFLKVQLRGCVRRRWRIKRPHSHNGVHEPVCSCVHVCVCVCGGGEFVAVIWTGEEWGLSLRECSSPSCFPPCCWLMLGAIMRWFAGQPLHRSHMLRERRDWLFGGVLWLWPSAWAEVLTCHLKLLKRFAGKRPDTLEPCVKHFSVDEQNGEMKLNCQPGLKTSSVGLKVWRGMSTNSYTSSSSPDTSAN